jgi:hypothetical protein
MRKAADVSRKWQPEGEGWNVRLYKHLVRPLAQPAPAPRAAPVFSAPATETLEPAAAAAVDAAPARKPVPQFEPLYGALPDSLTSNKIFLIFLLEWDEKKGKFEKTPINPTTGRAANNPKLGVSFDDALAALDRYPNGVLGMYVESPFTVVDIDSCRDPLTDAIEPWVRQIITDLDSYAEISPSGTGVHILVESSRIFEHCKKGIEIYSTKRPLTLTGLQIARTPETINPRDLSGLYERMMTGEFVRTKESWATPVSSHITAPLNDSGDSVKIV